MTTNPRHPILVAQQVQVLDQLAPGRLRLGLGASHRGMLRSMFGYDMRAPPPLIAHAPVCLHDNPDAIRLAVEQQLSKYPQLLRRKAPAPALADLCCALPAMRERPIQTSRV